MKAKTLSRRALIASMVAAPLAGQNQNPPWPYPPRMQGAEPETYKAVEDGNLRLWKFTPVGYQRSDKRAAIVFFFGGGWTGGTPQQFEQQCRYVASRGMVAMTADYRVASRHQAKVTECIRDAKSAIRWVRANAGRLGIDPNRIAAGGGSAGGHIAAAAGVIPGMEEAGEDLTISSRPNALVLFNPVLVMAEAPNAGAGEKLLASVADRLGGSGEAVSPYHHVKKGDPPTLILHGKSDTTVPYRQAEAFTEKMQMAGNRCELEGYEGQNHGFFNAGRGGDEYYRRTMARAEEFLRSLGYIRQG